MFVSKLIKKTQSIKYILKHTSRKGISLSFKCVVNKKTFLEGSNTIGTCNIENSHIGFGTYIGSGSLPNCLIGRFCSISYNVNVQPFQHPTDFISTYPGFFSKLNTKHFPHFQVDCEERCLVSNTQYDAVIGNDVWIGQNVTIKGGVTIGDGAIVGMGAVVTKNVEPYSIVGGVPAKLIKYRFHSDMIKKLLEIKWWNWEIKKINENKSLFTNVPRFIEIFYEGE